MKFPSGWKEFVDVDDNNKCNVNDETRRPKRVIHTTNKAEIGWDDLAGTLHEWGEKLECFSYYQYRRNKVLP